MDQLAEIHKIAKNSPDWISHFKSAANENGKQFNMVYVPCAETAGFVTSILFSLRGRKRKEYDGPVITLSHFLPRRELLPAVENLNFKGLPLVAGALMLDRQIRALNAVIHVFGHSHIDFDQMIVGVRYIHRAFDYLRREGHSKAPLKQIWESVS
jgi:hypothetical protein